MSDSEACENTDREIWRGPDEGNGSYYADSIFITKDGALGINCGGSVHVRPIREWHMLAGGPIPGLPKHDATETKAAHDFIVGKSEEMVKFAGMPAPLGGVVVKYDGRQPPGPSSKGEDFKTWWERGLPR